MATFSYITTCKGRLEHLKQSLPLAVAQPGIECIVVDYGCPDGAGGWALENFPTVRVVRVDGVTGFNASHARNLGARVSTSDWLGFFDADVLPAPELSRRVLPALRPGRFYRANPLTYQTWGTVICHRDDFFAIEGYDEAYVGWGGEDDDLIAMLLRRGVIEYGFPATLLGEINHGEEQRMRYFSLKNRPLQSRINLIYLQAKLAVNQLGGELTATDTRKLYAEVERELRQAAANARPACSVNIHLPEKTYPSAAQNGTTELVGVQLTLSFRVTSRGTVPAPELSTTQVPMI